MSQVGRPPGPGPRIHRHKKEPTAAERRVLKLLLRGLTDKAIAGALNISHSAVGGRVCALLNFYGVNSRAALIVRLLGTCPKCGHRHDSET